MARAPLPFCTNSLCFRGLSPGVDCDLIKRLVYGSDDEFSRRRLLLTDWSLLWAFSFMITPSCRSLVLTCSYLNIYTCCSVLVHIQAHTYYISTNGNQCTGIAVTRRITTHTMTNSLKCY
ncbi:uncharacterized protein BO87DRAFT_124693 [Aspergillus neoniger CBS 115656]|uniref:Uncharacterized protein n=1 Tax=Aspergillus neoniger (strain CBS 115656) TaxID=1448310 RepID=A0A318YCS5_ASPNB|nr:hypothetical protein BO87DRAFT_124693 [Aspergillus neoniger CBS 115656]PYH31377.1 hypothetical protein BO87DRAFT_124693 [Aspergillus neoniger CBS 115656]